jgi:hypothetical protein
MKDNVLYVVLGVASGLLLARIVPNVWWANLLTVGLLLAVWFFIKWRQRHA